MIYNCSIVFEGIDNLYIETMVNDIHISPRLNAITNTLIINKERKCITFRMSVVIKYPIIDFKVNY